MDFGMVVSRSSTECRPRAFNMRACCSEEFERYLI
jgi:hypothetical protein